MGVKISTMKWEKNKIFLNLTESLKTKYGLNCSKNIYFILGDNSLI
jgi:hypothetical protein